MDNFPLATPECKDAVRRYTCSYSYALHKFYILFLLLTFPIRYPSCINGTDGGPPTKVKPCLRIFSPSFYSFFALIPPHLSFTPFFLTFTAHPSALTHNNENDQCQKCAQRCTRSVQRWRTSWQWTRPSSSTAVSWTRMACPSLLMILLVRNAFLLTLLFPNLAVLIILVWTFFFYYRNIYTHSFMLFANAIPKVMCHLDVKRTRQSQTHWLMKYVLLLSRLRYTFH